MQYKTLGSSPLKVSRICLGTMTWGVQNNQEDAFAQMDYALERGVNFWDTAEMYGIPPTPESYGTTETIIGNWFKQSQKRDKVILATKFSPLPWARGEAIPQTNRKTITQAVEESLKRLQTDYIDLYQLHWSTNRGNYHFINWWHYDADNHRDKNIDDIKNQHLEILETFQDLITAGKICHIGISNESAWGITQYAHLAKNFGYPKIASIQNEFSLLRRRDQYDVAETCVLENIGYLSWSPLAMGVISGKYLDQQRPAKTRFAPEIMGDQWQRFSPRVGLNTDNATRAYIDIAKKHHLDVCQMAIAFTLQKSWQTASIIGATNLQQLKNNIDAIDVVLSEDCLNDIHQVYQQYPVPF